MLEPPRFPTMMTCTLSKNQSFLLDVSFAKYFVTAMRKAALTEGKRLPSPGAASPHSSLANTPDTHHLAILSRLSFGTLRRYETIAVNDPRVSH